MSRPSVVILDRREWGSGDRVAVLLHGMMGSSASWHRVGPALAERGFRVVALDLPGHGGSDRLPKARLVDVARAVVEACRSLGPRHPELVIGHSFGGLVLAAAVDELDPAQAVYVDAPTSSRGGHDLASTRAEYEQDRLDRTFARLRETRPWYSEEDCRVEAEAARLFDPATAASIAAGPGGDWSPSAPPRSLMIRAEDSAYVSDEAVIRLIRDGVEVSTIAGASHSIWYGRFDAFMAALDGWLAA